MSWVFFVRVTSWDSGVLLICHNVMYICCRPYRGRLFTTSGWCVGKLLPVLDMLIGWVSQPVVGEGPSYVFLCFSGLPPCVG